MEMDVITIEVGAKVTGKGVEIDHGHVRGAHNRIGHGIVRITVGSKAVKGHVQLVVDPFITRGRPDPDQGWPHRRNQSNDGVQIFCILVDGHLTLSGLWVGFDIMQATVDQKQIGV